ncbi:hypothetical protein [Embleya hyalina]|uniref:Thioredoxin n=1 Tax=Embleya hyalina TaxID=516124 RepID=A0A401Z1W7_9ACTN|nr:hypothetical protein [Embleya hyalina]GCE00771.1 thioredoxin [Embleya hyalina]
MNAERTGLRVEEILTRLGDSPDPDARVGAEELVRALMDFYGTGLARLAALLRDADADRRALLDDELVTGLLVLHDLHPDDVPTRVTRGLAAHPEHRAEFLDYDEHGRTLRLRITAASGGCGCAGASGSAAGSPEAVEGLLAGYAPEVERIEIEDAPAAKPEPALLHIGTRPADPARAAR